MAKRIIFFSIVSFFLFFLMTDSGLAAKECDPSGGDSDCIPGHRCILDEESGKNYCRAPLEIVYPAIPSTTVPETTAVGLPKYVQYIFHLAVVIIGFIIFGALVYAGFNYLTSAGSPAKLSDAKTGIVAAFLGAVILLASYLIFHTINPQLTILKLAEVKPLSQIITPGVYICSYEVTPQDIEEFSKSEEVDPHFGSLEEVLNDYIDKGEGDEIDPERQIKAAGVLGKIMTKSKDEKCPRANFSGNFDIPVKDNFTMFIIPSIEFLLVGDPPVLKRRPIFEYGIILHEKDDQRGKCWYHFQDMGCPGGAAVSGPGMGTGCIYTRQDEEHQIADFKIGGYSNWLELLKFKDEKAKSFTVFKKPIQEPPAEAEGIILYKCLDYDRTGMCPNLGFFDENTGVVDGSPKNFRPGGDIDIRKVPYEKENEGLGDMAGDKHGTRSVRSDPRNSYFAIFFSEGAGDNDDDNYKGECSIVKRNDPNILDLKMEKCTGATLNIPCWGLQWRLLLYSWRTITGADAYKCVPCIRSMVVIKGEVL